MVLKSYAKINLSLSVNKKLKCGLHAIQSIFCMINLSDKIHIKKLINKNRDKTYFSGPCSKFISNTDNSILKTLKIMRKLKLISNYYSIRVDKKIPVFAGLGGGTSNAAAVFKFLKKKKVDKITFNKIINYVGSDFRLFFHSHGYLKSLSEVVKISKKYKLYFLIIYPNINCSTKEIYSSVKKFSSERVFTQNKLKNKISFIKYINSKNNDLQLIVEKKYPIIKKLLKNIIKEKGCYLSKMSGSGSACYGVFKNEKCSKAALDSLRKKYPKFWFSIAKTI